MGSEWAYVTLEEAGDIKSGKRLPKGENLTSIPTSFPYVRLVDISDGQIQLSNMQYLTSDVRKQIARYIVNTGDIGFAIVGHTIGMVFYVDERFDGANLTENAARLTNVREAFVSKFLYYYFTSEEGQTSIASRSVGSAQGKLPLYNLRSMPVPKPPIEVQEQIASILSALDNKIALNRQINTTLESMAQALFKSWFVDFDPVIDNALAAGNEIPDALQKRAAARAARREALRQQTSKITATTDAASLEQALPETGLSDQRLPSEIQQLFPDRFVLTEDMGWVPEGWEVGSVGAGFDVTMGQSPPGDTYNEDGTGMPFFQGRADFGFRYPTNRVYCTSPKRFAKPADTLVSVRAPVGDVNMASENCCIGRGVAAVRHSSGASSYTYYAMLQLREHFKVYEGEGTVFGSINQKDFKALPALEVPDSLLEHFEMYASKLDRKIELSTENINSLVQLRDTLLPKLLSGQITIPGAEQQLAEVL